MVKMNLNLDAFRRGFDDVIFMRPLLGSGVLHYRLFLAWSRLCARIVRRARQL